MRARDLYCATRHALLNWLTPSCSGTLRMDTDYGIESEYELVLQSKPDGAGGAGVGAKGAGAKSVLMRLGLGLGDGQTGAGAGAGAGAGSVQAVHKPTIPELLRIRPEDEASGPLGQ